MNSSSSSSGGGGGIGSSGGGVISVFTAMSPPHNNLSNYLSSIGVSGAVLGMHGATYGRSDSPARTIDVDLDDLMS